MKIDSGLGMELPRVAERVGAAEAAGLDCVWAAETTNDPFLSLTLAAEHSTSVSLGTGIAVAFARNPMSMAYTTNQLQEYSGGRVVLGMGSQVRRHIEKRFSSPWSHPAARMREYVLALRAIWASWNEGATLEFEGEFYTHTLMTPVFAPRPHSFGPPRVFLAAVGPLMNEVAGEVADGVITHGICTSRYLQEVILPAVDRGLTKAARRREEFEVTCPGFIIGGRGPVEDGEGPQRHAEPRRLLRLDAGLPARVGAPRLGRPADRALRLLEEGSLGRDGAPHRRRGPRHADHRLCAGRPGRGGGRPLRRSGRPDQRLVVAQGLVARRRAGAAGACERGATDVKTSRVRRPRVRAGGRDAGRGCDADVGRSGAPGRPGRGRRCVLRLRRRGVRRRHLDGRGRTGRTGRGKRTPGPSSCRRPRA